MEGGGGCRLVPGVLLACWQGMQLALAARGDAHIIHAEALVPGAERPPDGVDVGELLDTARLRMPALVDVLTVGILDARVTQRLVEALREVMRVKELEHYAVRVDACQAAR